MEAPSGCSDLAGEQLPNSSKAFSVIDDFHGRKLRILADGLVVPPDGPLVEIGPDPGPAFLSGGAGLGLGGRNFPLSSRVQSLPATLVSVSCSGSGPAFPSYRSRQGSA